MFGVQSTTAIGPRYNIAPTQQIPVIREDPDRGRYLSAVRWGQTTSWANDLSIGSSLINTLVEDLAKKTTFSCPSAYGRCLIPANGFYIWDISSHNKQPWYVTRKDGSPMALAGLLQQWKTPGGKVIETCTIITTAAIGLIRPIHERMPATVSSENFQLWLAPSPLPAVDFQSILRTEPPEMLEFYSVSSLVNRPACDSADCIKQVQIY